MSGPRPSVSQKRLPDSQCRSVKVKRLFMFLAEACNHAWIKSLDLSTVDGLTPNTTSPSPLWVSNGQVNTA